MASAGYYNEHGDGTQENNQDYDDYGEAKPKAGNVLPIWGNPRTMNINNLILTNIQASPYFKVKLYNLKTYHEVIDEIYYKIDNLEPWERGSRKTAGQTGMCGGVRGVGTGGIVSTGYCILYKLFTLKLTRKQLIGMLNHADSPYIRGLGFMYIRYCQPPKDLFSWFEPYLDDEEEIDCKAGGGATMTVGSMVRNLLTKLEWFDTLFPRIPVPIQKQIEEKLKARMMAQKWALSKAKGDAEEESLDLHSEKLPSKSRSQEVERKPSRHRSHSIDKRSSRHSYDRDHHRNRHRDENKYSRRSRSKERSHHSHSHKRSHHRKDKRSRSRDRKSRSKDRRSKSRDRRSRSKDRRSRSRDRSSKNQRSRSHERSHKKKHKSHRDHS